MNKTVLSSKRVSSREVHNLADIGGSIKNSKTRSYGSNQKLAQFEVCTLNLGN